MRDILNIIVIILHAVTSYLIVRYLSTKSTNTENLINVLYRLFSYNLLLCISHNSFDCLLQQCNIQPVPNLHPPTSGPGRWT